MGERTRSQERHQEVGRDRMALEVWAHRRRCYCTDRQLTVNAWRLSRDVPVRHRCEEVRGRGASKPDGTVSAYLYINAEGCAAELNMELQCVRLPPNTQRSPRIPVEEGSRHITACIALYERTYPPFG